MNYLIVDDHAVHRLAAATKFVDESAQRLRLIRLPGYCPELNPDELLNQDVKTNALDESGASNKVEMFTSLRSLFNRRKKKLHVIRNLFQEKHAIYAD